MTVGLPGAGIGGLFYLLAALLMPFRELVRTLQRRSSAARWSLVGEQFAHAVGIAAGTYATGWLIVAGASRLATGRAAGGIAGVPTRVHDLLRPAQGLATLATLVTILLVVAVLGRVLARPAADSRDVARDAGLARPEGTRPLSLTPHRRHALTPSTSHPAWRRRGGQRTRGK